MEQALVHLLPLAIAAALSSVPITATIFILLSENGGRAGPAFAVGIVVGSFATVTIATVAGQALPGRPRQHDDLVDQLAVVIGVAMILVGLWTFARRRRDPARSTGSRWMREIGSLGTLPVLGVGLALNIRPKAVLLATAAGLVASGARLDTREALVLIVCYVAIASSTVVVPIVAATLFPDRVEPRLDAAKGWITAHSAGVSATISTLIGAFLIAVGLSG